MIMRLLVDLVTSFKNGLFNLGRKDKYYLKYFFIFSRIKDLSYIKISML